MKPQIYRIFFLLIICLVVNVSYAQVGIGTTTPDTSSMLDIQSTAKGVLIPRMTTVQRLLVKDPDTGKPANGLLVFDTTSKSFWFYNGTATTPAWKELVSGSSIVDADDDTKVEVEKTADLDEINFTTTGVERMKIGNTGKIIMGTNVLTQPTTYFEIGTDGVIKLGNKGASTTTGGTPANPESDTAGLENYTKITADGSLSYVGNATRWDDIKVPVNAVKIKNVATEPNWDDFLGNTALLWFDNGDDVIFTVQMPHAWKEGTTIYPHVHWTIKNGNLGTDTVTWGLEYSWQKIGQVFGATKTSSGTNLLSVNSGLNYEHLLTPLEPISGSGMNLSSMLVCRLTRSSGTYGPAGLLEIDFHYQIDSDGSNQEFTKTN